MLRVWRLVTARYASTAFSSDGARIYGRLERRDVPMVYATGSQSLAVLETLVQDQPLRARYLMIPAMLPKNLKVERLAPEGQPANWRSLAALIIFKIGTLYSPLKLFLPVSLVLFALATGIYAYTYTTGGRFTNMSALLYTTSLLTFLIGLVSEQITNLMYQMKGR